MSTKEFFLIILGKDKYKEGDLSAIEMLNRSFVKASECRYLASSRLRIIGKVSSLTCMILSLGLIVLPLLQSAGLQLSFTGKLLGIIQIFLAVSVLVCSVKIERGRYSLRE